MLTAIAPWAALAAAVYAVILARRAIARAEGATATASYLAGVIAESKPLPEPTGGGGPGPVVRS